MKDLIQCNLGKRGAALLGAMALIGFTGIAMAALPVVKPVRWDATRAFVPHSTYSGKSITLKGTCDQQGANLLWIWDFGDGSPLVTGTVTDKYAIEATHAYTGAEGVAYTAQLTVTNTATGEVGIGTYPVRIFARDLPLERDIAAREGLWYLHKSQYRTSSGGVDYGDWTQSRYGGYAYDSYVGISALNVNAFEVWGYLESGDPNDPYTETVQRGLRSLFTWLVPFSIGTQVNGLCTFNPDSNTNGIGILCISQGGYQPYQSGMFMDAIIASGTPNAVATTGPANVIGRTYKDIVQDMVDAYAWAQYDSSPQGGGWRYDPNTAPDNSACQWAAIGMIPAEREWGCIIPQCVKDWNIVWLKYSQCPTDGGFGYTVSCYYPWGPYATTPSGLVQLAMDGICRGVVLPGDSTSRWDLAETYICNDFRTTATGTGDNIKDYYYGLLSFTKAMFLHNCNGVKDPITFLQSKTAGVAPIDWFWDQTNGVARTLVNDQSSGGYWWGHNAASQQFPMETAMALIMMNNPFVIPPVPVIKVIPNPGLVNSNIVLDGSASYDRNPTNVIVQWEWDLNNDGVYETSGPIVTTSFPSNGTYRVWLRVTDDATNSAATSADVKIVPPPVAPTANAGKQYIFCPEHTPWYLDGRGSVNPDDGICVPCPGSTNCTPDAIVEWAWDLKGGTAFTDAFGAVVDVTAFFAAKGPSTNTVNLRVKDRTSVSYPCSGSNDLTGFDSATVIVQPACSTNCTVLTIAHQGACAALLTWTPNTSANAYNIYRSGSSGGPYSLVASIPAPGTNYVDTNMVCTATNYYVVRCSLRNYEFCQSNEEAISGNRPPVAKCKGIVVVGAGLGVCTAVVPPEMVDDGSFDPDGDPLTLALDPLGPYGLGANNVNLMVCDNHGVCSSCQATIMVVDAEAPVITCPANIVVDFSGPTGAMATFAATATDNCAVADVICTPPSGSTFPIGTNTVICIASDSSSNLARCSFTVTVLGASGVKQRCLDELAVLGGSVTNKHDREELEDAIEHLAKSLNPDLWVDQTHLQRKHGDKVFEEEKHAVQELVELLKDKKSTVPDAALLRLIDCIVRADRLLAVVSLDEAVAAGMNPKKIAEDRKHLAEGDLDVSQGHFAEAIDDYRSVWKHALHLRMEGMHPLANGVVQLKFVGLEGQAYMVQASTNLADWVTVGTCQADTEGNVVFDDADAGKFSLRFYRVIEPETP